MSCRRQAGGAVVFMDFRGFIKVYVPCLRLTQYFNLLLSAHCAVGPLELSQVCSLFPWYVICSNTSDWPECSEVYNITFGLILNSFILCVFSLSSGTNSQRDHWGRVGPQQSALVVWREGGGCGRLWRPSVDLRHRRGTDDSRVLLNTSLIPKQWDAVWRLCEQNVIVCWTQLIFNVLPHRLYWFLWIRSFWLWHVSNKLEQFNRRLLRW